MKQKIFILISFLLIFLLLANLAISLDRPWKKYNNKREDPWQECKSILPDTSNNWIEQGDITKADIFIIHIFSNIRITFINLRGFKSGEKSLTNSHGINHNYSHGFKRK